VCFNRPFKRASSDIPDAHGAILGPRHGPAAVRAQRHRGDALTMSLKRAFTRARLDVPHAYALVARPGDRHPSVVRQCNGGKRRAPFAAEAADAFDPFEIPEVQQAVSPAADCQRATTDGRDTSRAQISVPQDMKLLSLVWIPDANRPVLRCR
jgi:hypothetical protein